MPTYKYTAPNGESFDLDAEDDAQAEATIAEYEAGLADVPAQAPPRRNIPLGIQDDGVLAGDPTAPIREVGQAVRAAPAGPLRMVAGLGQTAMAGVDALPYTPGTAGKTFSDAYNAAEQKVFGTDSPVGSTVAKAGEAASQMIPLARGAKGAQTLLGTAKQGAKLGALGAATSFDKDTRTPAEAAFLLGGGAAIGGAVAPALSAVPLAANWLRERVEKGATAAGGSNLAKMAADPTVASFGLNPAMATGDPQIVETSRLVGGARATDFVNKKLNQLRRSVRDMVTGDPNATRVATDVTDSFTAEYTRVQRGMSRDWDATTSRALAAAAQTPNVQMSDFSNMKDAMLRMEGETGSNIASLVSNLNPKFKGVVKDMQAMTDDVPVAFIPGGVMLAPAPPWSLEQTLAVRQAAGRMRSSAQNKIDAAPPGSESWKAATAEKRFAQRLANSIDADAKVAGMTATPAWGLMDQAKAAYTAAARERKYLQNSSLGVILGNPNKPPKDAIEALDTLMRKPQNEQIQTLSILRRSHPGVIEEMKQVKLNQVLKAMVNPADAAKMSDVSPERFLSEMRDGATPVGAMFWTKPERVRIEARIAFARTILNAGPKAGQAGERGIEPVRAQMAIASRALPFVVSIVARLERQGSLERALFSESGYRQLQAMNREAYRGNARAATEIGTRLLAQYVNKNNEEETDDFVQATEEVQ